MRLLHTLRSLFTRTPRIGATVAAGEVRAGRAVLIDVREPGEWETGYAEGARRLPLTDLVGARRQWEEFLATARDRPLFCYCGGGVRSAIAARVLAREGFPSANAGALGEWEAAGWPIVRPDRPTPPPARH